MKRMITTAILIASAVSVYSQITPLPLFGKKVSQPWNYKLPAYESRVLSCSEPFPVQGMRIAMDDWICPDGRPIIRVNWWGTLKTPAQGKRPYYIAIYRDVDCRPVGFPQQPLYKVCVVPNVVRYVGTDCKNERVFFFSAALPATNPFRQERGVHYWLQISEIDQLSVTPFQVDFKWSAHIDIKNCPALGLSTAAGLQPLPNDPCYDQRVDLAFQLQTRGIIIHIPLPWKFPTLTAKLYDPNGTSGDPHEILVVEPDEDGYAVIDPESADGNYRLELSAPGMLSLNRPLRLEHGSEASLSDFAVLLGDLNGDDCVNDFDLTQVVFNFGKCGSR